MDDTTLVEIQDTIEPSESMIRTTVTHKTEHFRKAYDWSVHVESWNDLRHGLSSHDKEEKESHPTPPTWVTSVSGCGRGTLQIRGRFRCGEGDRVKYNATIRTYLARPDGVIVAATTRYNNSLDDVQDGWSFCNGGLDKEFPEKTFIIRHVIEGTVTTKETVTTPLIE